MAVGAVALQFDERIQFNSSSNRIATDEPAKPDEGFRNAFARQRTNTPNPSSQVLQRIWHLIVAAAELEWARGIGFLLLCFAFALGAITYFNLGFEPSFVLLSGALLILLGAIISTRRNFLLQLMLIGLAGFASGLMAGKVETSRLATRIIGDDINTEISGRLVSIEEQAAGRFRLTVDIHSTARPKLRYAPDRIRATARKVPEGLKPGDQVKGSVRLMPPSGPVRPGSYDFAFRSYFDGLGAIGFFMRDPVLIETDKVPTIAERAADWIESLRMIIAAKTRAAIGGAEGEIAAALIAGVRAGIPEPVNEDLRITGLAHVLSISGLHMALVAGTCMGGLRLGFAFFPNFSSRYPVKKYTAALSILALSFYLLLAGDQVAATRSFLMLAIMLAAILFDRAALSLRNLALAGLLILIITPHEIMGPSFQMSFAATAALIAGYQAWGARKKTDRQIDLGEKSLWRRGMRFAYYSAIGLCATSILAGLATTIFGIYHFLRVSPLTLVANLATMPLVSIFVMPFAVIATLAMPFGLEFLPLKVMGFGLKLMMDIAHWIAVRSPVDHVGMMPKSAFLLLSLGLVIACITTTWLRLFSLPLVLIGLFILVTRDIPAGMISEDARLVAIESAEDALATNRRRPNGFTINDWRSSLDRPLVLQPKFEKTKPASAKNANASPEPTGRGPQFSCTEDLCTIQHHSGTRIAWLASSDLIQKICAEADLIIVEDATVASECTAGNALIVSKRDLAIHGSALIDLTEKRGKLAIELKHAISLPYRPWHDHRRFSRAARGMAPYKRPERPAAAETRDKPAITEQPLQIDSESD